MPKIFSLFIMPSLILLAGVVLAGSLISPAGDTSKPQLTIRQVMNDIITPATATIWAASELKTDAEWLEVENAALSVIEAGNLMTGAGEGENHMVTEADWGAYNDQMITAAKKVIVAAQAKDEEALFNVGNNDLYPPCESCHQKYQKR